jgi:uncharacterized repeat protein (TIGR03847 family)
MSRSFELPEVDWATVGTIGEPGHRTFYLQARQGDQVVTLKLEKQQVAAMAQFLEEILSDLPVPEGVPNDEALGLLEPVLAEWAVGGMQLAYDSGADRIVIMAEEVVIDSDEDEEDGDPAPAPAPAPELGAGRLGLTREQAAGIVRRGFDLVSAGRPRCTLCGHPMDPEGHSCPRTNGHRPPSP